MAISRGLPADHRRAEVPERPEERHAMQEAEIERRIAERRNRAAGIADQTMKNMTRCILRVRWALARSSGWISTIDAPVVPITPASSVPMPSSTGVAGGLPAAPPRTSMPPPPCKAPAAASRTAGIRSGWRARPRPRRADPGSESQRHQQRRRSRPRHPAHPPVPEARHEASAAARSTAARRRTAGPRARPGTGPPEAAQAGSRRQEGGTQGEAAHCCHGPPHRAGPFEVARLHGPDPASNVRRAQRRTGYRWT